LLPTATSTPANAQNPAGPSGTETKSADELLLEKRYVDEKGKPLPKEKTFPYPKNLETEYKMMPIRMSLVIDQRELPKLLAECANSDMPIEVRRIRFIKSTEDTPMTATPRAGGGTMGPPPPGAMGPGGMMGPQGRMGPGMGPGMGYPPPGYMPPPTPTAPTGGAPADMGNLPQEAGQYDIPVEIYAILYIYNPPNIAKLGTGAASTTNPAEAVAPASSTTTPGGQATPAANPANPAAVPATRPPAKP
jgi:hypothetical protein